MDPLGAYLAHLDATGRRSPPARTAARKFFARWPDPAAWAAEDLAIRLGADAATTGLIGWLMLGGLVHPGYDYLVARKLASLWRELPGTAMAGDVERFLAGAAAIGYSERARSGMASQVAVRLLIETGRGLDGLTDADFDALAVACAARSERTGKGWRHYSGAIYASRLVLFHLGVLDDPPVDPKTLLRKSFEARMADVADALRPSFVAYLDRLVGTHSRLTIDGIATRLAHFGRHLAVVDPALDSLAGLDRRCHIEPYFTAVAKARSSRGDGPLAVATRRARVVTVSSFLGDIAEWGWPEAPTRRLVFRSDIPKLPRPLPRYLPPDADRRLAQALEGSANRLFADALLLARACGLRIGELVDLELDCVHEVPGQGAWLKVPLGKLDTERMVPLDDETVAIIDRIAAVRSSGRPIRHPRTGRPVEFLLTHHGRRLSMNALRAELSRCAADAGIDHATPHQLRHTYATALVNAGVSLQSLMVLLGHQTAAMSLRYGRLFDVTVRDEYERALTMAKTRMSGVLPEATPVTLHTNWRDAPMIKSRLSGGYCIRAEAQGTCTYANICEHCPNFRTDTTSLGVLAAQRVDTEALAIDAERRGWIDEADRHHRL
ncbi:MAG: site-specific integrase, partial [Actinomycetota bacterium]|nr:site-specific integrase [Actinomycetota bacterium]